MTTTDNYRPDTQDRLGLWAFIVAGVLIAGFSSYRGIARIAELLGNSNVPVLAQFGSTEAAAILGEQADTTTVILDTAYLTVPELSRAGVWYGILEQLLGMLGIITVIVCLLLIARGVLRGELFSRRSTALAAIAGITGLATGVFANLCGNLAGAEAVLQVTGNEPAELIILSSNPGGYIIAAFIISLVVYAFSLGTKIRRDTEGLV